MTFNYLQSYVKMPVSSWCYIPTSLPQEPSSILYYLCWIRALDTKRPVASLVKGGLLYRYMPSPFYPSSVVFFQLHGGMVSHMQELGVHNTKYLDPYLWNHTSFSCLFLRQWCRDVASGADRHLDIGLLVVKLIPCFHTFREAFSHPYISFFHLLVNGFCVTSFRTFFADPLPSFNWWAVSLGGENLKMASASTPSVNEPVTGSF